MSKLFDIAMKQIEGKAYVTALKRSRIAEIWMCGKVLYDKKCKAEIAHSNSIIVSGGKARQDELPCFFDYKIA